VGGLAFGGVMEKRIDAIFYFIDTKLKPVIWITMIFALIYFMPAILRMLQ